MSTPIFRSRFALEELYFLEYATPASLRAGIPNLDISLRQTIQQNESWHHGWVREADRLPIEHWLDQGETVQLIPLRSRARFPGTVLYGETKELLGGCGVIAWCQAREERTRSKGSCNRG
jgi:hypothetical protein